jgi:hypothetical protein
MFDKTTRGLTIHCWLHTSVNRRRRKPVVDFAPLLLRHTPQDAGQSLQYRDSGYNRTLREAGSFESKYDR